VLDPHGDLIERVIEHIPPERWDDVVLVDPADEEYPVGFNILSAHTDLEKTLLASDLVGIFQRLSTSWGDQMTSVLGNAILAFLESDRGGTLPELRRFLIEPAFRKEFLTSVKDAEVVYYWQKEFGLVGGKSLGPLLTRLDTFLRPKSIRYMVAQKVNRLNFGEMMDTGKIFLAKLSLGMIGEENAYLLGSVLVAKFQQLAMARQAQQVATRKDFHLYIDEFHNFITPSMAAILTGARKYRLALILAHQEMRQLGRNAEVAGAVMANPYTRVCFRVGNDDARRLAESFATFEAQDLQNLGTGEAICRMERADYDFNLRTIPLPAATPSAVVREEIYERSRRKYASARSAVEQELAKTRVLEEPEPPRVDPFGQRKTKVEAEGAPAKASEVPNPAKDRPKSVEAKPVPVLIAAPPIEPKVPATKPPVPKPMPAAEGRGGTEHQKLQKLFQEMGQGLGWLSVIEDPIPGGSVDVTFRRGQMLVACQISETTGKKYEVASLKKCLVASFTHIVVVSRDPKHLAKIETEARKKLASEELKKLHFFEPDGFSSFLRELTASTAGGERTFKGYRVKTSYKLLNGGDAGQSRDALGETVARAAKRLWGKAKGPI